MAEDEVTKIEIPGVTKLRVIHDHQEEIEVQLPAGAWAWKQGDTLTVCALWPEHEQPSPAQAGITQITGEHPNHFTVPGVFSVEYTKEERQVFWDAFEAADTRVIAPEKAAEDALRRYRVKAVPE